MLEVRGRSADGSLLLLVDLACKPLRWYVSEGGKIVGGGRSRKRAVRKLRSIEILAKEQRWKIEQDDKEERLRKAIAEWEAAHPEAFREGPEEEDDGHGPRM
jgi:hypothetical protein